MQIDLPDTKGRYYLMPLMDMWTDVFAVPGSRASGTSPRTFYIKHGIHASDSEIPGGADVIESPTPYSWIIMRIKTDGPKEYRTVSNLQDGASIRLLGNHTRSKSKELDAQHPIKFNKPPLQLMNEMSAKVWRKLVLLSSPSVF